MSEIYVSENKPQNIMQAYKMAILDARKAEDFDAEIEAYRKVIDFCRNTSECRKDTSIRRQVLLRWAYEKIAEAYWHKKDKNRALNFFESSFNFARNRQEQNSTLEKMGEIYWETDTMDKWFDVREKMADNLSPQDKRAAYLVLAREAVEEQQAIDYLEQALQAVSGENGPLDERMQSILDISDQLMTLYRLRKDNANLQRLENLSGRVEELRQKISLH